MRTDRIEKLESKTREAHRAAWHYYFQRFRATLDALPGGMFKVPFKPVELDDLDDLEPALRAWESWADAALPVLSKAGDLSTWPHDLPPTPGDPSPLISELVSRWRKHPGCSVAAMLVLLGLGAARWGEGG